MKKTITRSAVAVLSLLTALAVQVQAQQTPTERPTERPGQFKPKTSDDSDPAKTDSKTSEFKRGDLKAHTDSQFIQETAKHNEAEVKLGQLAAKKSSNSQVKQFANQLVQDHTRLGEQLRKIAEKQNVTWPLQGDAKHQEKYDKLQAASGTEFDQEFAKSMIKGHAKSVAKFQQASQTSSNSELRGFTEGALPKLREHLRMAQNLGKAVGLDEATITSLMREGPAAGAPGIGVEIETGAEQDKQDKKQDNQTEKDLTPDAANPDKDLNRDDQELKKSDEDSPKKK